MSEAIPAAVLKRAAEAAAGISGDHDVWIAINPRDLTDVAVFTDPDEAAADTDKVVVSPVRPGLGSGEGEVIVSALLRAPYGTTRAVEF